ncbi:ATP-dependent DNA helicase rep [Kingella potus]|uniref:ATP-dependent DNA helicase Rep n=1 Tax=Kingella potus TaxID=265175 RepID=A0A377R004_9NEIS|nr:UvrD-helicase domain-containing protein [Kingella potus]STR00966.1 ATP-dependent DNA helicase rep [Kingella potus]
MQLNPSQTEAVRYLGGPLFVLAGAGSGKTRVITEKIAYMITRAGYHPRNIAAITFTNKAAREMQERIGKMLARGQTRGLTVCTFHSLGMRMLREEAAHAGLKKNFSVLDSTDSGKIIGELLGSSGREQIFAAQHQISLWKNDLLTPEQLVQTAANTWEKQTAQLYASYQDTLHHYQAVDFDDLIRLPVLIMRGDSEVRIRWQQRLRYLLVDECQDTNTCQYALMRLIAGAEGMFTAVGDDDQSIYAWRGADIENLRRLQTDYPALKIVKLEQNYRSTARILKAANQVIRNNPKIFPKTLWSHYGQGDIITVAACQNEQHEAEWVAGEIAKRKAVAEGRLNYADFAILYRGNHQSRPFEEALRAARIPYRLSGGQSFFEKTEIKDILAYLRLIANPDDDPAFLRAATTPKRGIGGTTLGRLNEYAKAHHASLSAAAALPEALAALPERSRQSLAAFAALIENCRRRAAHEDAGALIRSLLDDIGYEAHLLATEEGRSGESKWRNVQDLCAWIERKSREDGQNLIETAQTLALMTMLDQREDEEADAVKMSTLHAAKGLEYPIVYLVGCEEGLFPHADSLGEGKLEEERRLMYVGITRAKQSLTLTHCTKRKRQGEWQFPEPSRFIAEMPQEDLKIIGRKGGPPLIDKTEGRARLAGLSAMIAAKRSGKKDI